MTPRLRRDAGPLDSISGVAGKYEVKDGHFGRSCAGQGPWAHLGIQAGAGSSDLGDFGGSRLAKSVSQVHHMRLETQSR